MGLLGACLAVPAGVAYADGDLAEPAASGRGPAPPPAGPSAAPPTAGRPLAASAAAPPIGERSAPAPAAPPAPTPVVAPRFVDCAVYMLHHTAGPEVEGLIARNLGAGRRPVTVGQLGCYLLGTAAPPPEPLFCLSFDDGYRDQFTAALPVLARYSCPATFFVMSTGWRGDGVHQYMTPEQIVEATQIVEIGSHTINHDPNLIALRRRDPGAYRAEVWASKQQLEALLGRPVTSFASPASVYDETVIADVAAAGYSVAVMTALDQKRVRTGMTVEDRLQIPRARVT
jgi:peptidoglycan/xylan/chitin deacetylase (PgdA/CDA1 family)